MKRYYSAILLVTMLGFLFIGQPVRAGCNRTGLRLCESALTDTVFFYAAPGLTSKFSSTHLYLEFSSEATGSVKIIRWMGQADEGSPIYAVDDPNALTLVPGQRRTFSADGVVAFSFVKTVASDELKYEANNCLEAASEWMSSNQFSIVDTEAITITDGYHTAATSSYAFLPLQPLGDHNIVAIELSWATADTIWVEALCSNNPMDSLSAFNFGTSTEPVYSRRFVRAVGATDTAPSGFTAGVGGYTTLIPFSFLVQDADGYPGLPRFTGVRVRAPAAQAITSLKIVLYLGTLNTCGGE